MSKHAVSNETDSKYVLCTCDQVFFKVSLWWPQGNFKRPQIFHLCKNNHSCKKRINEQPLILCCSYKSWLYFERPFKEFERPFVPQNTLKKTLRLTALRAAQNALAGRMRPAGRSLPNSELAYSPAYVFSPKKPQVTRNTRAGFSALSVRFKNKQHKIAHMDSQSQVVMWSCGNRWILPEQNEEWRNLCKRHNLPHMLRKIFF